MSIPTQVPASGNPGSDGGVRIGGFVAPTDYSDPYPSHVDILGKGWFQTHVTLADRDAIIESRRSWGMYVAVTQDPTPANNGIYELQINLVDADINNNANRQLVTTDVSVLEYIRDGYSARFDENISLSTVEDALDYILDFASIPPSVSLATTPSAVLREFGDDVVNPELLATPQLGSNPTGTLTLLEWFRGTTAGTLINSVATPTPNTGVNFQDTFTVANNQQYTVRVTDSEARTGTASRTFSFTYPMWVGIIDAGDIANGGTYTRAFIDGLAGLQLRVVNQSNQSSTTSPTAQRYAIIYPAGYGNLSSIIDDNGFETIGAYDVLNITIDPMLDGTSQAYRAYVLDADTTQVGFTNQFIF